MQVGAVLGKGGATINQIRTDSGATVRVVGLDPDEERHLPREVGSGQHRVISIAGDPDKAMPALTTVTDLLQESQVCCPDSHHGRWTLSRVHCCRVDYNQIESAVLAQVSCKDQAWASGVIERAFA